MNKLEKGTLGGQAVIEGVMMKGPQSYSIAVRKPDQTIEVKHNEHSLIGTKNQFFNIPIIRGVVNFIEAMVLGVKTLTYSSSFYEEVEEETKADKMMKHIFKERAEDVLIGITVLFSIVIAIGLFMLLPTYLVSLLDEKITNHMALSALEGLLRLSIFLLYVVLISQMQDIKRMFMYHGAEHKTINCYESGEEVTPENVMKYERYHKRCGTSFLFIVIIISIIVFMFIQTDTTWLRMLYRVLLLPLIAGISYEFIKFAGKSDSLFFHILSIPGMWVQKLTTKEPEREMIEVAIISVEAVLYGKEYADAVNEAQGIGRRKRIDEEVKSKLEDELYDEDELYKNKKTYDGSSDEMYEESLDGEDGMYGKKFDGSDEEYGESLDGEDGMYGKKIDGSDEEDFDDEGLIGSRKNNQYF